MAVLSAVTCAAYRSSIRSVAASTPEDSSLPTRIAVPSKNPLQLSTGVAPGDYSHPPTNTKLRKYYGGVDEDPVTATDDFIWNKEFLGRMQRLLDENQATPNPAPFMKAPDSGFLSLNRVLNLDSMEIDLNNELRPPLKPVSEQKRDTAETGLSGIESANRSATPRWRFAPTRREQTRWGRASKSATGGSDDILRESKRAPGDPKLLAAKSREQYIKLKQKLQILTISIGGLGVVSTYFSYSPEVAVSFGAGMLGSLVYIRMLGNTVDSMASGAKGFAKGALAQPRLLVPVVLVMMYNRWNELVSSALKNIQAATFVQVIQDALIPDETRELCEEYLDPSRDVEQ